MSHDYDRREAARKPIKLTDDEKKALTDVLGRNLRQLNFSTFELDKIKPNVVKSLNRKGLIYARYDIRFEPRGYDIVERLG